MAELAQTASDLERNAPSPTFQTRSFIRNEKGRSELTLAVSGAKCGGCISKIEQAAQSYGNLDEVRMNLTSGRLFLAWSGNYDSDGLVKKLDQLGFPAHPFDAEKADTSRQKRERQLLAALAVAGFASANVMLLSVSVWSGGDEMPVETRTLLHWISALIAIPAIGFAGRIFFGSAWNVLKKGQVNMDVPISLAIILAVAYSIYETTLHGKHSYFDAAIMLCFFLLIGRFLEARLQRRTHKAAEDLATLQAVTVARLCPKTKNVEPVAARDLEPGDIIYIAKGERFPVDTVLQSDTAQLDARMVTGENRIVTAAKGVSVYSGTLNVGPTLQAEVLNQTENSLINEISKLLDSGEQKRSKYRQAADFAAELYVPVVFALSAAAFIGWLFFTEELRLAIFAAISVLVITCPCALALAAPVVQIVAAGKLFAKGTYLKSGDALERIHACDHVVFDKTGTLTELKSNTEGSLSDDQLALVAQLSRASRHPASQAISDLAGPGPIADMIEEHKGLGVSGTINGKPARLGSHHWVTGPDDADQSTTGPWFWIEGSAPFSIDIDETPRPGAVELITYLRKHRIGFDICSGDDQTRVDRLARKLSIDAAIGGMSPLDKVEHIKRLADEGKQVLMIGDGLNDAGALSLAHAALAPGGALDIARTASDCVYASDTLEHIVDILEVARTSQKRIKENFGLANIYNIIAVPVAFFGLVTPLIAALAMSASSIVVTLNALRIKTGENAS